MCPRVSGFILAIVAAGAAARAASAATWRVPGDHATIAEALASPRIVDGDEIVLTGQWYAGPGNRDLDFAGKELTIRSAAGDPTRCVIDCGGVGRGFVLQQGEGPGARIVGVEIRRGFAAIGGGVLVANGASPVFVDCILRGNVAAGDGGGMACFAASPRLLRCRLIGNTAATGGGIRVLVGNPVLEDCRLEGNAAVGTPTSAGGGMAVAGGAPLIVNTTFHRNAAAATGGAVYTFDAAVTLRACRLLGNAAPRGGGAWLSGAPGFEGCLFSGNRGGIEGGGLFVTGGAEPRITSCTIVGNVSAFGGGLVAVNDSAPRITNSVLWHNVPDAIAGGGLPEVRYSDVEEGFAGPGNIDVDPQLRDPDGPDDRAGTPDDDARPAPGSPVIDAGDSAAVPGLLTIDLDGAPRIVNDPTVPDTGAGGPPVVDMGSHENPPTSWTASVGGRAAALVPQLRAVLAAWGPCPGCREDRDGSGAVGLEDLLVVMRESLARE